MTDNYRDMKMQSVDRLKKVAILAIRFSFGLFRFHEPAVLQQRLLNNRPFRRITLPAVRFIISISMKNIRKRLIEYEINTFRCLNYRYINVYKIAFLGKISSLKWLFVCIGD